MCQVCQNSAEIGPDMPVAYHPPKGKSLILVTPARFERATFPLGGGRLRYARQRSPRRLCQCCARGLAQSMDYQAAGSTFSLLKDRPFSRRSSRGMIHRCVGATGTM